MISLGDRMLDLEARVHLHEVEAVALSHRNVGDELDGAGAGIVDRLGGRDGGLAHGGAHLIAHAGAGASSMTFWWRRCSEQSRSNRWTTLPWSSPNT